MAAICFYRLQLLRSEADWIKMVLKSKHFAVLKQNNQRLYFYEFSSFNGTIKNSLEI